jgi:NADH:ubiquinone reductase (non-electrogenic)
MKGADGIFAIGDCTATSYAPTAQVAAQEGAYLARVLRQLAKRDALAEELVQAKAEVASGTVPVAVPVAVEGEKVETEAEKRRRVEQLEAQVAKTEKIRPFKYSHQGSLAYAFPPLVYEEAWLTDVST